MEPRKLLEYYYNLILFTPDYPEIKRTDYQVSDERRYVPYESIFGGESEDGYDIYIGKADTSTLEEVIASPESFEQGAETYVAMLKTDKRGYYIKDSFYISPVIFALAKIIKEFNSNTSLDLNLINKANDEFDEFLVKFDRKLEYKELKEVFNYVVNKLNLGELVTDFTALIQDRDTITTNENDGYLRDLEKILLSRKNTENIDQTVRSIYKVMKNASPFKDDMTPEKLKNYTSPEKNSLGIWPGHERLTLNQQVILNGILQDKSSGIDFFRQVNTDEEADALILEYMASNIVERAIAMSRYTNPDEAFTEVKFKRNTEYSTSYYKAEDRLIQYNTMVTGIGKVEVDKLNKLLFPVLTGREEPNYYEVDGVPVVINQFTSNRDVWRNIQDVYKPKESGLKTQINEKIVDYDKARTSFRNALDKVIKKREMILNEYRITYSYQDILEKVNSTSFKKDELKVRVESIEATKDFKEAELNNKRSEFDSHLGNMRVLEDKLGLFKKYLTFFFKNDPDVKKYQEMEVKREALKDEVEETNRDLNKILNEYHNLSEELAFNENEYKERKAYLEESLEKINTYKEKYGAGFTDDEILHSILRNDYYSTNEIWTDEEYNDLRANLFFESLNMHRAFINNSRYLKTDLNLFNLAMEGKINETDLVESFKDLLEASAIVYPLMYISFDYAPYLLSTTGAEAFGTLIMKDTKDMPLSKSMGYLWRFSKIIAFNCGGAYDISPAIPKTVAKNISRRIAGEKDPELLDNSLSDVFNVL